MPRTPDRFPGSTEEESIRFESGDVHPLVSGEVTYVTNQGFRFFENGTERGLLKAESHIVLIALAAEGHF